ncbi:MAG: DUF393 domain-containing protein [Deltaproteobacteria bacterium]|nr:DUF393 domain-containing protein [Deltaproteobacteria bacterium]
MRDVILFDGDCGLCSRVVRFVLARDSAGRFAFASLQGAAARGLLGGRTPALDSFLLVRNGAVLERSEAALAVARGLGWPWRALGLLRWIPRAARDAAYDVVARHRALLGPPLCELGDARWKERSLDTPAARDSPPWRIHA